MKRVDDICDIFMIPLNCKIALYGITIFVKDFIDVIGKFRDDLQIVCVIDDYKSDPELTFPCVSFDSFLAFDANILVLILPQKNHFEIEKKVLKSQISYVKITIDSKQNSSYINKIQMEKVCESMSSDDQYKIQFPQMLPSKVKIGIYSGLDGILITDYRGEGEVYIGNYTALGRDTMILLGGDHEMGSVCMRYILNRFANGKNKNIVQIGHDVWIGREAMIFGGVSIGNGAVVGARSVVTKDVPPYAVVAGNPAKVVRYRFPQEIVKKISAIEWWYWEKECVEVRLNDFRNPGSFIEKYGLL